LNGFQQVHARIDIRRHLDQAYGERVAVLHSW
jgi:hypothetical protein